MLRISTLLVLCVCAVQAAAQGPVFDVNSTVDAVDAAIDGVCDTAPGDPVICTLRAAIMEANADLSGEEVTIHVPAGTYTFLLAITGPNDASSGDLNLTGKVRIVGAGADALDRGDPLTTVDANHLDRVFRVEVGAEVTLEGLRIQGGRPTAGTLAGGGILGLGTLTLRRCLVRDNATVLGSLGGGIYAGGSLTVEESVFRVNTSGDGGGIFAFGPTTISRSTINSNGVTHEDGGGVYFLSSVLRVVNSTISDNTALSRGGGLYCISATCSLNNVTVARNRASHTERGAGLYSVAAVVQISNSVFDNYDTATFFADDIQCTAGGTVVSNGYNWINSSAPCVTGTWQVGGAFLAAFADNGGLTFTRMVSGNGVDAGDPAPAGCADAFGNPLLTDQRGVKRVIGTRCDVGAVEKEPIGDANGDGVVNVSDVLYLINTLFAGGPVPAGRANVNGDASVSVADVLYLINYLFAGGPAPA